MKNYFLAGVRFFKIGGLKNHVHQDEHDPWSRKNSNSSKPKNSNPPELDKILQNLRGRLKETWGSKNNKPNGRNKLPGNFQTMGGLLLAGILSLLVLLYVLAGFFKVGPGEEAVVFRFGKYVTTFKSGLCWLPPFISTKKIINTQAMKTRRFPKIQMITKEVNLVDVSLSVVYRIKDLKNYLFSVQAPEDTLAQATESAMREVIAQATLDEVLSTRVSPTETLGQAVQNLLNKILDRYQTGLLVESVNVNDVQPPLAVKDAFADAIKARGDEKSFINEAEAYQIKVLPLAKGKAFKIIANARAYTAKLNNLSSGETTKFKAIWEQYRHAPEVIKLSLYLDSMNSALKSANLIYLDNLSNNLVYLPLDKLGSGGVEKLKALGNDSIADLATSKSSSEKTEAKAEEAKTEDVASKTRDVLNNWRRGDR